MAFSHAITYGVSVNGGTPSTFNSSQSFDGQTSVQVTVPASSTNFSIVCPIDDTLLKSVVMWTNQAAIVVMKDSGGATVDSFTMTADKPLIWQLGFPTSNPISGAVATLEVTCTNETVVTGYFGQDV